MKLIEALKKIKDWQRKAEDLRGKVGTHCASLSFETPAYPDMKRQLLEWIQAHTDLIQEILKTRIAIQKTNLVTMVKIDFGNGLIVQKSIAEWIHRRKDLAKQDLTMWSQLGDKGLREGNIQNSAGEKVEVRIVRHFDAPERDKKLEMYRSEPMTIDANLEIVNAVTDVIE